MRAQFPTCYSCLQATAAALTYPAPGMCPQVKQRSAVQYACVCVQVAKSLFWQNKATYGGGAYLMSGYTLIQAPECNHLPQDGPLFFPIHFADSTFVENSCGPPQAGASVFWNTPYLLHITCSGSQSSGTPYTATLSNCSDVLNEGLTQRYCHQCVLVNGCPDWQRNSGGNTEYAGSVRSQRWPTQGQPSTPGVPVVIVPIAQQRGPDVSYRRALSFPQTQPKARAPGQQLAVRVGRPDGMASGGVMLQVREPKLIGYAAGAEMNLTVDLLDAYRQVVDTDEFIATQPGATAPTVTVSQGQGDVFLSGQLTQTFEAGVAELQQLRLIGNPGRYRLQLDSAGAASAAVLVRSYYHLPTRPRTSSRTIKPAEAM